MNFLVDAQLPLCRYSKTGKAGFKVLKKLLDAIREPNELPC